jgi:serine/threonine protein kinase
MYEMISGVTPFEGSSMEVALEKIDHDPPPFSMRAPHIKYDRVLEAIMRRLLARDRDRRIPTAELALDLVELYERDRLAAATQVGVIDVERALQVVALPEPPR